jgi:hypothetical protein
LVQLAAENKHVVNGMQLAIIWQLLLLRCFVFIQSKSETYVYLSFV